MTTGGALSSRMVMVWVKTPVLPESSVASQVRVNTPALQSGGGVDWENVTIREELQLSVADKLGGAGTWLIEAYWAVGGVPAVMIFGLVVSTKDTKNEK